MHDDLLELSAGDIATAIAARQLSARDVMQAILAQIDTYNPTLNAIFTKRLRTTFGSKLLAHDVPKEDSICVERLRTAGGVLVGKTNTPEVAVHSTRDMDTVRQTVRF
jgi:Asp-tRNA(Asn)/Glu-tRNA(Gln) amidotransferase A subunit family amidase